MDDILAELLAHPAVGAVGTALAATGVALWFAAAWWAYRDAGRRTESALAAYLASGWIVASTPLLLPLSLLIYRFARPQVAAADQRAASLARDLSMAAAGPACTGCGAGIDPSWVRCPACATWLGAPCAACGAWSDPGFDICPWCGIDQTDARQAPAIAAAAATAPQLAGHGTAAAGGLPAAAGLPELQRRAISSARPFSYARSRDASSTSS